MLVQCDGIPKCGKACACRLGSKACSLHAFKQISYEVSEYLLNKLLTLTKTTKSCCWQLHRSQSKGRLMMQIVLLGVCWGAGNSSDPLNEINITPLPDYSISSDNVSMCSTACTPDGRIFLGGADGHLYEVLYNTGSGWRQKRCTKVSHHDLSLSWAMQL